jgi:hypothetical protein
MGTPVEARAGGVTLRTACERLDLSRERLRQALLEGSAAAGDATGRQRPAWLQDLAALPGAGILIEALRTWWARHPLQLAGQVGVEAARAVLQPLARSHPLALLLGALLVGGVLAWARPWRWILKPAWLAGLGLQLFHETLAQARRPVNRPAAP